MANCQTEKPQSYGFFPRHKFQQEESDTWDQWSGLPKAYQQVDPGDGNFIGNCPNTATICLRMLRELRTILGIQKHLSSLEECIHPSYQLSPEIITSTTKNAAVIVAPRLGGLGIKIFTKVAPIEFENSNHFTKRLQEDITKIAKNGEGKISQQVKNERRQRNNVILEDLRTNMPPDRKINATGKQVHQTG